MEESGHRGCSAEAGAVDAKRGGVVLAFEVHGVIKAGGWWDALVSCVRDARWRYCIKSEVRSILDACPLTW